MFTQVVLKGHAFHQGPMVIQNIQDQIQKKWEDKDQRTQLNMFQEQVFKIFWSTSGSKNRPEERTIFVNEIDNIDSLIFKVNWF